MKFTEIRTEITPPNHVNADILGTAEAIAIQFSLKPFQDQAGQNESKNLVLGAGTKKELAILGVCEFSKNNIFSLKNVC